MLASKQIECGFLSSSANYFTLNQTLSQGMNLLATKVHDVISVPERQQILKSSKMSFLNLALAGITKNIS